MRLLLDTHTILWMLTDDSRLTDTAKSAIVEADEVFYSMISLWEIGIKHSLERLNFKMSDGWEAQIPDALRENQVREIPLASAHCGVVSQLPWHHRDPFDRLLIAKAKVENMTLVSADRSFTNYDVKVLW